MVLLSIGEKVRILLDVLGLKQKEAAPIIGVDRSTFTRKLGIGSDEKPGRFYWSQLADFLIYHHIDLTDFYKAETKDQTRKLVSIGNRKRDHWAWIPVIKISQLERWDWMDINSIDHNKEVKGDTEDPKAFFIPASGPYMTGHAPNGSTIREGHLLLVEPNAEKINGCLVLCNIDAQVSVKIWHDEGGIIILQALGPNIAPITLVDADQKASFKAMRITRFSGVV